MLSLNIILVAVAAIDISVGVGVVGISVSTETFPSMCFPRNDWSFNQILGMERKQQTYIYTYFMKSVSRPTIEVLSLNEC